MPAPTITGSGDVQRKLLGCAVNVGTEATPEWEWQGYKVEDSSVEISADTTTVTDVRGDTYTDIEKMELKQTFDPNYLKSGAKLSAIILEAVRTRDFAKLQNFGVLIVYGFLGSTGAYEADHYPASTIVPSSLGGSAKVGMPFDINYGGEMQRGTVNALGGDVTFKETVAVTG